MDVSCLEKEPIMPFIATPRMENMLLLAGIPIFFPKTSYVSLLPTLFLVHFNYNLRIKLFCAVA